MGFMDNTVKDWVQLGMLLKWKDVRKSGDPYIHVVVSPLGVESKKPRALWDGRYANSAGTLLLFWIRLQRWLR